MPSLHRLTELWRLDIGSLKGMECGLAPFLAALNLREIQLSSTCHVAPGDAELLRDHPRVLGFTWYDGKGSSAAEIRALLETANRRLARDSRFGRPPEPEVPPQRLDELAPEQMTQIVVTCHGDSARGKVHPVSAVGDVLLSGHHDYGPGLVQIAITLRQGANRPNQPKIKLQPNRGKLAIEYPSDLPEEISSDIQASPDLLARAAGEVVAALEAARERTVHEVPEFDVAALIDRCRKTSPDLPSTPEGGDALVESAENQTRTLRVAMHRLRERANKEGT